MRFFFFWVVSTSPNPQAVGLPLVGCPRLLIQFIHFIYLCTGLERVKNIKYEYLLKIFFGFSEVNFLKMAIFGRNILPY
jgi:hypothetical protein